jgi:hypothetical protein
VFVNYSFKRFHGGQTLDVGGVDFGVGLGANF